MSSSGIHTTPSPQDNRVSSNAAESTFHEVDDQERAIPAIEFRDVLLFFDDRTILNRPISRLVKGETKIILGGSRRRQVDDHQAGIGTT